MKQLLVIFFLLVFTLVPISALEAVSAGEACGNTDGDPNTPVITCDAGLTCTGGLCIDTTKLPPESFRLGSESEVPTSGAGILARIQLIANWVFALFLALSVIYIILAAFQFVTGGGDPAQVSGARQKLIYALIGIAIALIAAGFPAILRSIVAS